MSWSCVSALYFTDPFCATETASQDTDGRPLGASAVVVSCDIFFKVHEIKTGGLLGTWMVFEIIGGDIWWWTRNANELDIDQYFCGWNNVKIKSTTEHRN